MTSRHISSKHQDNGQFRFTTVDPLSPDAVASVTSYFTELNRRFPGGFEPGTAIVDEANDFRPPKGQFVCLYFRDEAIGCGGVKQLDADTGEVKRMWIAPLWRGQGLGGRLLTELEDRISATGLSRVVLDTNSALTEAVAMYEKAGYHEIPRYNDNPYALKWFEKRL